MKPLLLFSVFIFSMCYSNCAEAQTMSYEMALVQKFMEYSLLPQNLKSIPDSTKLVRKALISPKFLKEKNLTDKKYLVNMYVPQNFKIASTEGSEVQVYIWGANGFWRHELFFRVEKEDGEYYIVPSPDTEVSQFNLFDPWVKVVKNSNFDKAIMKKE